MMRRFTDEASKKLDFGAKGLYICTCTTSEEKSGALANVVAYSSIHYLRDIPLCH